MKKFIVFSILAMSISGYAFGMGNCMPLTINNCSEGNTVANGKCECHGVTRSGGGFADCSGVLCGNSNALTGRPTGNIKNINLNQTPNSPLRR